jgi:hypothetical protein
VSPSEERPPIAPAPLLGGLRALWKADARWAKILEIKRTGRVAQIRLEVHEADLPPFEQWTRTFIPFGQTPEVGDDVYWVDKTQSGSTFRAIAIRWRRAPNYGSAQPSNEELQRTYLAPFTSNPVFAAAQERAGATLSAEDDPAVHRGRLERRRAAGQVTEAQYAERLAELDAWERGLEQVQRAGRRP